MRWLPLVLLGAAQKLIVSDVNALRISVGAIVDEFGISSADVQTALVVYSLTTAAFVTTSAKPGALAGSLKLLRGGAMLFAVALAGTAFSTGPWMLVAAQAIGGAAAALLRAVVAHAANYEGSQRTFAVGVVSAAGGAVAMVLALSSVAWRADVCRSAYWPR
jgi:MFS family permease